MRRKQPDHHRPPPKFHGTRDILDVVVDGQVEDLEHGVIGGERASGLGHLAELEVQRLDGICIGYEIWDATSAAF